MFFTILAFFMTSPKSDQTPFFVSNFCLKRLFRSADLRPGVNHGSMDGTQVKARPLYGSPINRVVQDSPGLGFLGASSPQCCEVVRKRSAQTESLTPLDHLAADMLEANTSWSFLTCQHHLKTQQNNQTHVHLDVFWP